MITLDSTEVRETTKGGQVLETAGAAVASMVQINFGAGVLDIAYNFGIFANNTFDSGKRVDPLHVRVTLVEQGGPVEQGGSPAGVVTFNDGRSNGVLSPALLANILSLVLNMRNDLEVLAVNKEFIQGTQVPW